ncbi:MAG: hypothetical protein AB8G05_10650 [Oligoflexales bacterium]
MAGEKKKKIDPFKTRKTKSKATAGAEPLSPPDEIMEAIDSFREKQEQAKHFEGEATIYKDSVLNYCQAEYSKKAVSGQTSSFKVLGAESMVHYVVQNSSAGLTEEELHEFEGRWGENAASELINKDFSSIKFDPKVLEQHYDQIVDALQVLPEEILDNLFKPMLMKAAPGALEKLTQFTKTPEEFLELMKQLKIKNYIK